MEKILDNAETYKLPQGLEIEVGTSPNNNVFNANVKKNGELIGTLGDFRFLDYDINNNNFFSYLLSIDIETKHKHSGYGTIIFDGLIKLIKQNYSDSTGLLIDQINSSQGKKYLHRIAEKLQKNKSINKFTRNNQGGNYIFLEF